SADCLMYLLRSVALDSPTDLNRLATRDWQKHVRGGGDAATPRQEPSLPVGRTRASRGPPSGCRGNHLEREGRPAPRIPRVRRREGPDLHAVSADASVPPGGPGGRWTSRRGLPWRPLARGEGRGGADIPRGR